MYHETTIKRLQELVPSVMALEFGCEVRIGEVTTLLSDDKIKSLKDKYGRCFLESDFFEGDEDEPYIKIAHSDTVSEVQECINSNGSPFTVNKIDPIFNTFSVISTQSYGEKTSILQKTNTYDCRINLEHKHQPIEKIILRRGKVLLEILGKPITLSHILLASKVVMIDTVGIFYDVKTLKPLNIGSAWDLSQNYDGQSEKTKDIIDKIVA